MRTRRPCSCCGGWWPISGKRVSDLRGDVTRNEEAIFALRKQIARRGEVIHELRQTVGHQAEAIFEMGGELKEVRAVGSDTKRRVVDLQEAAQRLNSFASGIQHYLRGA